MKPILIWIDDLRNPERFLPRADFETYNVVWCKSYNEFMDALASLDFPSVVYFDHDLGDINNSGRDCAQLLVDYCINMGKKLPEFHCQSQNPVGRENILSLLKSYRKVENMG